MSRHLIIALIFMNWSSLFSYGQECLKINLACIPGSYIDRKLARTTDNVSATDLAKENIVLDKIFAQFKPKFSPVGGDLRTSRTFGFGIHGGKNWKANPYMLRLAFHDYYCDQRPGSALNYAPNPETSSIIEFEINQIYASQETAGAFELFAADLPEDHPYGYLLLEKWPQKKEGYFEWENVVASERYPLGNKIYLLTKSDKLPFIPFTKGEYLRLKIPKLKESFEESQRLHQDIDPTFDAASKRVYEQSLEIIKTQKAHIDSVELVFKNMTLEELNAPAIIAGGEPNGEFWGFKSENDPNIYHLVKPDPGFFDPKLLKWVPQLISVSIGYDLKETINLENIQQMEKAVDFNYLKSLLGKTNF